MLLLMDNGHAYHQDKATGSELRTFSARFDEVTHGGRLKKKYAEYLQIINDVLMLNGVKYQIDEPIDIAANPVEILDYVKKRYVSKQPDMFLEPPRSGHTMVPKSYMSLIWDYPDLQWRAMDKGGTVAYFKSRPVLDKAGFWMSRIEGELPKHSKYLCIANDYKNSLQSKSDEEVK